MSEQDIPHSVLSDAFRDAIGRRRLLSFVAATFRFAPSFFETQVLPVFFDLPIARGEGSLKLLQLEQVLNDVRHGVAVYYDRDGLETGDGESARLDVRRIRIHRTTGYFHPKNIFALVEDPADSDTPGAVSLIVGTMSANLTRSGWWENVEVCHIERLTEDVPTRMRDSLLGLCDRLIALSPPETDHAALQAIRDFLDGLGRKASRRADDGLMLPHFYGGDEPVLDFLKRVSAGALQGLNLEVISPYFDDHGIEPLKRLVRAFGPREIRVHLPAGDRAAPPTPQVYDELRAIDGASWAALPSERLRRGKVEQAEPRFVHAKVYRFFQGHPKKEFLFVGSVNLTTAAHQGSANLESGIFVEVKPQRRPVFWLEIDEARRVSSSDDRLTEEGAVESTPLLVRFLWSEKAAEVWWAMPTTSPLLTLGAQGETWATVTAPPQQWHRLPAAASQHLERLLMSTSFVTVDDGTTGPVTILVDEVGMDRKPSVFHSLSVSDVLTYWAQLTPEQKAAYLATHFATLDDPPAVQALRLQALRTQHSLFDRFSGTFHAFHCLEARVEELLAEGNERQASARFFGRQIDCLPYLLERIGQTSAASPVEGGAVFVSPPDDGRDDIDRYLIVLCARQLLANTKKRHPDFYDACRADFRILEATIAGLDGFRQTIVDRGGAEMAAFLPWFERWFLLRVEPQSPGVEADA
jgi:hypothetical protein